MKTIDRLIYDALAGRYSVALPGAGTLEVRRRGARKISDTRIVPPQNVVVFTPGDEGSTRNIVALVANDRSMSMDEAAELYDSWLEEARRGDGSITIEGVGETRTDGLGFVVAEPLHTVLNPIDEDIVTMETGKRSTPSWVWIVIAILLAALVAAGILLYNRGGGTTGTSGTTTGGETIEVVVPVAVPEPLAADSLAALEAARVEVATAEAVAANTAAANTAAANAAAAEAATRLPFHVIAGAFTIESNADNFVARIKREHPELTPRKISNPTTGLHMVSIIQTATRREAASKMNLYWDIDLYLWIYEQK